jgi:hypothetical protein
MDSPSWTDSYVPVIYLWNSFKFLTISPMAFPKKKCYTSQGGWHAFWLVSTQHHLDWPLNSLCGRTPAFSFTRTTKSRYFPNNCVGSSTSCFRCHCQVLITLMATNAAIAIIPSQRAHSSSWTVLNYPPMAKDQEYRTYSLEYQMI